MKLSHLMLIAVTLITFTFIACKEKNTEDSSKEKSTTLSELSQEEISNYKEIGKTIAKSTFMEMSGNLKKALQAGGVQEAAEYCNIVALPLTDSLSNVYNARIKRTSLKLRNTDNKPTTEELKILNDYEAKAAGQMVLSPLVQPNDDETVQFYAPIMTKQLCLSCHGTLGQELSEENYTYLKELYPSDNAIGYSENAFRGMWSIELKK